MIDSLLGGSIIGAGASLLGGFFQGKAAKKAAEVQANAARAAGQHVEDTVRGANPGITQAAGRAGDRAVDTAWNAVTGVNNAATDANARLDTANTLLDPYADAGRDATGTLRAGLVPGGDFNKTPTLADLEMDPGYAFRKAEGEKAIQRSAAARGGALGGGVLQELNKYGSGLASQEYQNAFQRFRDSTKDRFGNLFAVSGSGQEAATRQGGNLAMQGANLIGAAETGAGLTTRASEYAGNADMGAADRVAGNQIRGAEVAGNYTTDAGAAQAAGTVGGSNALWSGIGGALNGITGALAFNRMLKNPTARWTPDFEASGDMARETAGRAYRGIYPRG